MKCQRIRIYGRVQGVWFRASTKRKADELGLTGFVKNEKDGSVYVEVTGEADQLDQFISWCHEGPELAVVSKVEAEDIEVKSFTQFDVLR